MVQKCPKYTLQVALLSLLDSEFILVYLLPGTFSPVDPGFDYFVGVLMLVLTEQQLTHYRPVQGE